MRQTITINEPAEVTIFHMAVCVNCDDGRNLLPIPFAVKSERTDWVRTHFAASGHDIRELTEIRVVSEE